VGRRARVECRQIEDHPAVPLDLFEAATRCERDALLVVLPCPRVDAVHVTLCQPGRRLGVERIAEAALAVLGQDGEQHEPDLGP